MGDNNPWDRSGEILDMLDSPAGRDDENKSAKRAAEALAALITLIESEGHVVHFVGSNLEIDNKVRVTCGWAEGDPWVVKERPNN